MKMQKFYVSVVFCLLSFFLFVPLVMSSNNIDEQLKFKFYRLGKDYRVTKDLPWAVREQEVACIWLKTQDLNNTICEVNDRNLVVIIAELIELIKQHPKVSNYARDLKEKLNKYKNTEDAYIEFYSAVKMSEYKSKEEKDIMDYIGPVYFKISFLPMYFSDMLDDWLELKELLIKTRSKLFDINS